MQKTVSSTSFFPSKVSLAPILIFSFSKCDVRNVQKRNKKFKFLSKKIHIRSNSFLLLDHGINQKFYMSPGGLCFDGTLIFDFVYELKTKKFNFYSPLKLFCRKILEFRHTSSPKTSFANMLPKISDIRYIIE